MDVELIMDCVQRGNRLGNKIQVAIDIGKSKPLIFCSAMENISDRHCQ